MVTPGGYIYYSYGIGRGGGGKEEKTVLPNNAWNASVVQTKTPGKTKLCLGLWFKELVMGYKAFPSSLAA